MPPTISKRNPICHFICPIGALEVCVVFYMLFGIGCTVTCSPIINPHFQINTLITHFPYGSYFPASPESQGPNTRYTSTFRQKIWRLAIGEGRKPVNTSLLNNQTEPPQNLTGKLHRKIGHILVHTGLCHYV